MGENPFGKSVKRRANRKTLKTVGLSLKHKIFAIFSPTHQKASKNTQKKTFLAKGKKRKKQYNRKKATAGC